jgi:hypothetical protein
VPLDRSSFKVSSLMQLCGIQSRKEGTIRRIDPEQFGSEYADGVRRGDRLERERFDEIRIRWRRRNDIRNTLRTSLRDQDRALLCQRRKSKRRSRQRSGCLADLEVGPILMAIGCCYVFFLQRSCIPSHERFTMASSCSEYIFLSFLGHVTFVKRYSMNLARAVARYQTFQLL